MKFRIKLMGAAVLMSLGWMVFDACVCDNLLNFNHAKLPNAWVTCVNGQPTLYAPGANGGAPGPVADNPSDFDPGDYSCPPDSNSPPTSDALTKYPVGTHSKAELRKALQTTTGGSGGPPYQPQTLLSLPFLPPFPSQPTVCDSTYADVIQADHLLNKVTHFTTCPFKILAAIPVQDAPIQVAITPDGALALVTSFSGSVNFINPATNTVVYTLNTDPSINPYGIAISDDGTTAYITSFNTNLPVVEVINIQAHQVIANIETSMTYPSGLRITPDGSQVWVTSSLSTGVDVIDLATNTRVTTLNIGYTTDIAFNSLGTMAYITSASPNPGVAGQVYVVNTQNYQTANTYPVDVYPTDVAMSYGDQFLIVNNYGGNSISLIDLIANTVTTTKVGGPPIGIAFVH